MKRLTVTLFELNSMVSEVISMSLPDSYWVEAELSEAREGYGGHCYLELIQKDERSNTPIAKAHANCWRNRWMVTKYITANPTLSKRGANLKVAISILAAAVVMFAVLLPTMEKVDYIAFKNYSDRIDDMDTDSDNTKSTSYSSAVTVASDNDSLCFKMNIDEFINAYNDLDDVKKDSMLKLDMAKAKKSSFDKLDANQKERKGIMYQWNNQYSVMASVDRKDPNIQEGFVVFCNDYGEITGISYVITNHLFDIYEANGKSYLPTQDSYRAFSVVNPYLIFDEYCDILQEILDNGYTYKYDDGILYQCGKDEERDTWIYSMQALTKEDYEGYVNARENKGNN